MWCSRWGIHGDRNLAEGRIWTDTFDNQLFQHQDRGRHSLAPWPLGSLLMWRLNLILKKISKDFNRRSCRHHASWLPHLIYESTTGPYHFSTIHKTSGSTLALITPYHSQVSWIHHWSTWLPCIFRLEVYPQWLIFLILGGLQHPVSTEKH